MQSISTQTSGIRVSNEIGPLKRLLIHSPDRGLGKVIPSKAQDWLFEDIVHLDTMRRHEYDYYIRILLWFLDPERIQGSKSEAAHHPSRAFYKPGTPDYFCSDQVVEFETLLSQILQDTIVRTKITASICGIERCSHKTQEELTSYSTDELARIFISGTLPDKRMLFAPLPNLIFTRDLGIVINNHILLNKPAKVARTRETLLAQYVFFHHELFAAFSDRIIEIPDNAHHFLLPDDIRNSEFYRSNLEGGDVMVVSPRHVLIGCSERTSLYGAQQTMKLLFERNVVDTITILKIPKKRDYMHIDTLFTQVKKNVWVLLESLGRHGDEAKKKDLLHFFDPGPVEEHMTILQFIKGLEHKPIEIENLEDLLTDISKNDLGATEPVQFIYSGNGEFPFGEREQWTDSCNLLALKDGVVIGYDRNDKTLSAFRNAGFQTIEAGELLEKFNSGALSPDQLENTFIMLPSAELSRARGGPHCMSMPLYRENL